MAAIFNEESAFLCFLAPFCGYEVDENALDTRTVLGDSRLHELLHQRRRQRILARKPDRAFCGFETVKLRLKRSYRSGTHRIQRAMTRPGAERHQRPTVKPECRKPVTDAFLRPWCRSEDCFAQSLAKATMVRTRPGKVLIDGPGF